MKTYFSVEWPQFYTATIYEWRHLLLQDDFKNIITGSLSRRWCSFNPLQRRPRMVSRPRGLTNTNGGRSLHFYYCCNTTHLAVLAQ